MNKITNITKRQIKELFCDGVDVGLFGQECQHYLYWGKCDSELSFLKRLYPLDKMSSNDSRYMNAELDIIQHTINNDDWELCWVFDDERFPLHKGTDEDYLKFILEILNPEICIEGDALNIIISQIKRLLHEDGYELYVSEKISGKPKYSWRLLTEKEIRSNRYLPFSLRYEEELKAGTMNIPTIKIRNRKAILELMERFEQVCNLISETGWNYSQPTREAVWIKIKEYYIPKSFNKNQEYKESDNLENFILANYPQYVFDSIELYILYTDDTLFDSEINVILRENGYQLVDGKVQLMNTFHVSIELPQKDENLISLLQQAQSFVCENNSDNIQLALEKIWDVFERIKTACNEKDKKKSTIELAHMISCEDEAIASHMESEFMFLTAIGNQYQIRHFEKDKKTFQSVEIKKYFYNRCASLVNLCIGYLNHIGL